MFPYTTGRKFQQSAAPEDCGPGLMRVLLQKLFYNEPLSLPSPRKAGREFPETIRALNP